MLRGPISRVSAGVRVILRTPTRTHNIVFRRSTHSDKGGKRFIGMYTARSWVWFGPSWVSLAFINAGLAENKNRSKWTWLLLSTFLGPLATAYIVFTSPVKKADT